MVAQHKQRITLVTGGQRSGKSRYAETLARKLSDTPIYMATSRIWDEEHQTRIMRHQSDRGPEWRTIEEEKSLSAHNVTNSVVVVDCVTLWATNFFFDLQDPDKAIAAVINEFDQCTAASAEFIFVTNEIGLGGTSIDPIQRQFTDVLGRINQHIAKRADTVVLCVSGIPLTIKGSQQP